MAKKRNSIDQLQELGQQGAADSQLNELSRVKETILDDPESRSFGAKAHRFLVSLGSSVKRGISTPRFKRGGASALLTALFIIFVVLANLVAVNLTDRYAFLSPDMTSNQIYTLSDVTLELLNQLDEHVEIDIIASESICKEPDVTVDPYGHIPLASELIERYAQHNSNVRVYYIDITENPGFLDLVPEYRDSLYTYSIVVRSEKRVGVTSFYEMLPSLSSTASTDSTSVDIASSMTETYISSLIKTVTIDTIPVAAYLDCLGGGDYVGNLLDALALNGYSVLSSENFAFGYEPVPDEVQLVIIGAPEYDLTLSQLDQLSDFLYNDGNYGKTLLVLTTAYMQEMPNLTTLLSEWGMELQRATVYEGDSSLVLPMQNADLFYATYMDSQYIDDDISTSETVVDGALNIGISNQVIGNIVINGILCSSSSGYVCPIGTVYDAADYAASDGALRYIMAQATLYSESEENGSLRSDVIVGPASLCNPNYFGASLVYSNFPLMMNICNERCGMTSESLNIASKTLTSTDFSVDTDSLVTITVIFSYIVPIAIAVVGVVVCMRRRRL